MTLTILSWIAVVLLSVSYWFQIYKIHIHKEVRDISLTYNILLAVGFGILAFTAYRQHSIIFLIKQVATTLPVLIICGQVLYHRTDKWHEEGAAHCEACGTELEFDWKYCSKCGTKRC